ncbi:unnamed protein product [Boreogadus saida]
MPLVEKYGFHVATCCGYLPQENEWQDDWVTFYSRHRLQHQLNMVEKSCGDREARELWSHLQLKIPQMFTELEVVPALLHGDLWGGNVAQTTEGPVLFDPASFYGHSEYELGIMAMFQRRLALRRETSSTNFFTTSITGTTLAVATRALRSES